MSEPHLKNLMISAGTQLNRFWPLIIVLNFAFLAQSFAQFRLQVQIQGLPAQLSRKIRHEAEQISAEHRDSAQVQFSLFCLQAQNFKACALQWFWQQPLYGNLHINCSDTFRLFSVHVGQEFFTHTRKYMYDDYQIIMSSATNRCSNLRSDRSSTDSGLAQRGAK